MTLSMSCEWLQDSIGFGKKKIKTYHLKIIIIF